jgi:hypothetical protein
MDIDKTMSLLSRTSLSKLWIWFFSLSPTEKEEKNPAKKLLNSMRITAKCRFNASVRLQRLGDYSFFTTTIFSLGLIFIPLYQKSGLPVPYSEPVLNMLQIFLAVAVLVYSVVNATAKYDLRASSLDTCGVKIKERIRQLRHEISESEKSGVSIDLEKHHSEYHIIATEPENHGRSDYIFAILESRQDFTITGLARIYKYLYAIVMHVLPYVIPTVMIFFELLIISDIIGITSMFCGVLADAKSTCD